MTTAAPPPARRSQDAPGPDRQNPPAPPERVTHDDLGKSVAGFARGDFVTVAEDRSIAEALADVRRGPAPGRIVYFYVVDEAGRLRGVVPTRRLLLSPPEAKIRDVMIRKLIWLPESATVLDACELFLQHRLLALPVVAEDGRLTGVLDVELYTDEIGEVHRHSEAEDVFQIIGVRLEGVRTAGVGAAFVRRFPWLLANVAGGLACAAVSGAFSGLLARAVALAFFVPVVLALAESVSIQSLTLAIQALHGGRPSARETALRLLRELPLGALLGGGCATLVALAAWPWQGGAVAVCLLAAVTASVTVAAIFGLLVPTVLRAMRRDPKVAAGPITLAATDLATLTVYLGLGTWLLG